MSAIEIVAVVFGLLSVGLTVREKIWCWPTGIVSVALYIVVFGRAKLYADAGLQVVYVVLSIYGWLRWSQGRGRGAVLGIRRITERAAMAWAVGAVVATAGLGWLMKEQLGAALPYWDSAIVVMSLCAQTLMAEKVLECWAIWIAVDVLAICVYAAKGLYLTTGLYAVFLVLAASGLWQWRKSLVRVPA